jgi:segregation and condensation protein B
MEENQDLKKTLEAALFMAPSVVSINDLSRLTQKSIVEIRVALSDLMHEFNERDSALEIIDDSKGYRMGVKKEYERQVSHFASSPELHKGIMKTLALIAFRQPIKQSEIIYLRNQKAYDHIRILTEKGFIKKEKQGITYIITTTKKFADYFGDAIKKQKAQGKEVLNAQNLQKELATQNTEKE